MVPMAGVELPHLSPTHKDLNNHVNKYTPIDTPICFYGRLIMVVPQLSLVSYFVIFFIAIYCPLLD